MATLNLKAEITSTDLTSDALLAAVTKSATVSEGGIQRVNVTANSGGSPATLITAASYTPTATKSCYVYLKNAHPSTKLRFKLLGGGTTEDEISLSAGQWCLFPWAAATDITVYAGNNLGTLCEFGVFI